MGALRIISIILITIILVPLLLLSNLFMTLDLSYNFDNIVENTEPLVEETLNSGNMTLGQTFEQQCTQREQLQIPNIGTIPCSEIEQSNNTFESVAEHIYTQEYNCEFTDCYANMESPAIIVSEKTNENISAVLWTILAITLFIFAMCFLSFKRNSSFLLYMGIIMIIFSPTALLIQNSIAPSILGGLGGSGPSGDIITNALGIFFGNSGLTTIIWAALGVALITTSVIIKIRKKKSFRKQYSRKN